ALVVGAFFCCYVPMALFVGHGIGPRALVDWLLALLCLMGLAHVVTTMYRSGSRLFTLDLCLGALFVGVLTVQVRHLMAVGAGQFVFDVFASVAVLAVTIT